MSEVKRLLLREGEGGRVKAFTLLELLIVILLLSVFALLIVLSISDTSETAKKGKRLDPSKIKRLAPESFYPWAELICIDGCRQCFLHTPQGTMNEIPYTLPPLEAYTLDSYLEPVKLEFGRYRDKPICLRFRYYPNGSSDQLILQEGSAFYFIPSFFGKIKRFETLRDARDYWLRNRYPLQQQGSIY